MKSKLVLLVVCCLAVSSAADSLSSAAPQRSRAGVYVLEGLGALPGMAGCGCLAMGFTVVAIAASWGGGSPGTILGAFSLELVSVAVLPAAAAYGTVRVGRALGEEGSTGWAIGGAYAGLPLAVGAIALGVYAANNPHAGMHSYIGIPLYVLGGLAIPTGAVVGYNLGVAREAGPYQPGLGGRLEMPGVALTSVELPNHSAEYGVKVQLAGLRF